MNLNHVPCQLSLCQAGSLYQERNHIKHETSGVKPEQRIQLRIHRHGLLSSICLQVLLIPRAHGVDATATLSHREHSTLNHSL